MTDLNEKDRWEEGEKRAKARYEELALERGPFLERAYKCSEISIPSILPRNRSGMNLPTPFQSVAAQGTNNLAAKLMLSLLPTNAPFFKLAPDRSAFTPEEKQDAALIDTIEKGLAMVERQAMQQISAYNDRVVLYESLKHLIVCGNALLWCNPDGGMLCYHLDSYVVARDGEDNPCEIVIKSMVAQDDLDGATLEALEFRALSDENYSRDKDYELYTWIKLNGNKWEYHQEVEGVMIANTGGTCPKDSCDWIPLRMIAVSGENYGRSYIEEYYGDIKSLEGLTQAIIEGSAAAARILWLVAPNASTRIDDLNKAANNSFVQGSPSDIQALQLQKQSDFRVASETATNIERRLQYAFLLNHAIQRNGERVTAEEIRRMIEDLDTALGGVYTLLAEEFQIPYISARLRHLKKSGKIPDYPERVVTPLIVTGVEALGRGNDQQKLVTFLQQLVSVMPQAAQLINPETVAIRLATAHGIDTQNLVRSAASVAEEAEQAKQQELLKELGPTAMKVGGDMMKNVEQNPIE